MNAAIHRALAWLATAIAAELSPIVAYRAGSFAAKRLAAALHSLAQLFCQKATA